MAVSGKGTWRFDLVGIRPGSVRAIAGTVAVITETSVVFRMDGRAGERVVFTFDVDR
jgi:hypothetical protein